MKAMRVAAFNATVMVSWAILAAATTTTGGGATPPACTWSPATPGFVAGWPASTGRVRLATLARAQARCDATGGCFAVTKNTGAYELRAGTAVQKSARGETSWLLQNAAACRPAPSPSPSPSPTPPPPSACTSDLDCSLNGVCGATSKGRCACDAPWGGARCGELQYKVTPAVAKSLFPVNDTRNTWNGPIFGPDAEGTYHIFDPVYPKGNLGRSTSMLHGVASAIEGPWDWDARKDLGDLGDNPAFVAFQDGNQTKYALWVGGAVRVATDLDGPYAEVARYSGGNPAPVYHNGAWFYTTQNPKTIWTAPTLGAPWSVHATTGPHAPPGVHFEDPFMWVDARGHWHILGHAYNTRQFTRCAASTLSYHLFSATGATGTWRTGAAEPYGHTVRYDDGTAHSYCTLERPNLHFDARGRLTHINLAADLVTGDAGCEARAANCPARDPGCACTNCKYGDHAGTIVIALDV